MPGYFHLKTAANGQHMFNLRAGNHQVILTSELYKAKASALAGIESVRKNGTSDKNFERKTAKNGQTYFTLKSASNGQVIGTSEMYTTPAAREKGIASVRRNAASSRIRADD